MRVAGAMGELAESGQLSQHATSSVARVLFGFIVASIIAGICAAVVAHFPGLAEPTRKLLDLLRPIPPLAWIPLAILWFGPGDRGSIFIVVVGAFFPTAIMMMDAVRSSPTAYVETALTMGARRSTIVYRLIVPLAAPGLVSSLRVGLGVAWTSVIAAELVAGQNGLGYLLNSNRLLLRSDIVVACMIAIGAIGLALISTLDLIEHHLLGRWTKKGER